MFARHLASCGFGLKQQLQEARMDHATLRAAIVDYFRTQLDEAKARRASLGPFTPEERQQVENGIELLEEDNADYWRLLGREKAETELGRFFQVSGLSRDEYWPHAMRVLDEIRKGKIGAAKEIIAFAGELEAYDFSEVQRRSVRAAEARETSVPAASLNDAVRAFFDEHERIGAWTDGTFKKRRAALGVALEWFGGETSVADIGRREAAAFKTALLSLPANRTKFSQLRGLSLREAIAVDGVTTISGATVNSYLSAYKVFWEWAEAHGYASEVLFAGMKVGKKVSALKDRKPFSQEALEKTYNALTDPGSKFYRKTSHRWATLIAMFSGARLNEICQMQVRDIKHCEGTWLFDLTDEGGAQKRLKSPAARRRVPVHSHLIELGLLDFRSQLEEQGEERLFPDYTYSPKHGYGEKLSKWFNRTLTQQLGIKSDAHVFHGLRHTFITRLAQADVPTERIQFIVGHERQGVTHQAYLEGYTLAQTSGAVERYSVC